MAAALKLTPAEEALLQHLPAGDVADAFRSSGLPNRRTEEWRWTDLRAALKGPVPLSAPYAAEIDTVPIDAGGALTFIFANGVLVQQPGTLPEGVSLKREAGYDVGLRGPVGTLAGALVQAPQSLCIEKDIASPISVRYLSDGQGMHQTLLQVHVAEGVQCRFIETHETAGAAFANGMTEFFVGEGANVERVIFQPASAEAVTVQSSLVLLMASAKFHQTVLGFGGRLARFETRLQHGGEKTEAVLNGAYLLSDKNHFDATSVVEHKQPVCTTDETFKGVLRDQSKGVFQGLFHVAREAQQTDAQMAHHALLLSGEAEVNAKPELKIYADDVQCAHGNTAGALDDDALFYMRQRGLSEAEARAMLVEAFVAEVIEQVSDEALQQQLTDEVRRWMAAS
jgi:Fe-S cluster assembly protein SufD